MSQTLPFSGLWYWEVDTADQSFPGLGLAQQSAIGYTGTGVWANSTAETHIYQTYNGSVNNNGTLTSSYSSAQSGAVRFAVAWDGDNRAIYFGSISGSTISWFNSGDPTSGSSKTGAMPTTGLPTSGSEPVYFITVDLGGSSTQTLIMDEDDWTGSTNRPADAKALNSANLTAPDYQGIDYFNSTLYTGNGTAIGSGGKAVTGVGFSPSWVWIKNRDATDDHALYDIARGVTKQWESNTNTTASTESEGLTTFGSDGFTVGNLAQVNTNTEDYVSWNWLASGSTSTTSPAGTIASTSSVANAAHFSVGTYTGNGTDNSTVGHGLGGIPEMIIVRNLSRTTFGLIWHTDGGGATHTADFAVANQAFAANSTKFGGSDASNPTANVFKIGTHNEINASGESLVFYALRSISGVCKVGSYIGNSSDDGVYLSLGFKPRYWLVKCATLADASHNWFIADSARYTFNGTTTAGGSNGGTLEADANTAEEAHNTNFADNPAFDFLSDGIKLRTNSGTINGTGRTYVYMAMADIGGNGTLPPIYGR